MTYIRKMINRFVAALALLLYVSIESLSAQETVSLYDSSASENVLQSMTVIDERSPRQIKRDSVRANKRVWTSVMGGPSYTPEASLGVGGAVLLSFKTNPEDSVALRSFLPMGFNVSINGTFVVAGAGTLFFNENKFRIYTSYGLRNEPANF